MEAATESPRTPKYDVRKRQGMVIGGVVGGAAGVATVSGVQTDRHVNDADNTSGTFNKEPEHSRQDSDERTVFEDAATRDSMRASADPEDLALSDDDTPYAAQRKTNSNTQHQSAFSDSSSRYSATTDARASQHPVSAVPAYLAPAASLTPVHELSDTSSSVPESTVGQSMHQARGHIGSDVPEAIAASKEQVPDARHSAQSNYSQHSPTSTQMLGYSRSAAVPSTINTTRHERDTRDATSESTPKAGSAHRKFFPEERADDMPRPGTAKFHSEMRSTADAIAFAQAEPSRWSANSTDADTSGTVEGTRFASRNANGEIEINRQAHEAASREHWSARNNAKPEPESPRQKKTSTQELADFFRTTAPPDHNTRPTTSGSTAAKRLPNGVHTGQNPTVPEVPRSPMTRVAPAGQPRDAKVELGSTRDLADYAKSTGPENDRQLPQALSRPGTAVTTKTMDSEKKRQYIPTRPPAITTPLSRSATSKRGNPRLEPRDPDPKAGQSQALIDFIREGPPRAAGDHRIDRNIAPFRRTMDSDDLNVLAPGQNARSSETSTQEGSIANSRTGLLDNQRNGIKPQHKSALAAPAIVAEAPPRPKEPPKVAGPRRTQRRVRDPYAIPSDDDDEELFGHRKQPQSKKPNRQSDNQQESLMDFLRNTAPPPEARAQPIATSTTPPTITAVLKKKASGNKLVGKAPTESLSRKQSVKTQTEPAPNHNAEVLPPPRYHNSNHARKESPHLTQTGSKLDTYKPTKPTYASHEDQRRSSTKTGNTSSPEKTTREGSEASSGIAESPKRPDNARDENKFREFFKKRMQAAT